MEHLIYWIIIILLIVWYLVFSRLYWRMRSDNGYNMGYNHMRHLGFTDEEINRDQDDADADLYVFRKKQKNNRHS